ncbi:hypothetical protein COLU111180_07295 [Cohnella lubricantis]|uniref:Uncharacterized protein n=1 Tax=Cohnella lubricantis TaxID=2163172 RepID=A0A841TEQ0_9BACL|nr:hypothetical protein [Cohnella lubricantis]MBB6678545.1 hypothetical protein [Cohnella lubricantis]MBP2119146.1 hypothetical protein [Cohnella lubricantis]
MRTTIEGLELKALPKLLLKIPADPIWAGLIIAAACYWFGYPASDLLLLLYGGWLLWYQNHYWGRWTALFLFTGIGFIAAHRFDLEKLTGWLLGDLLPIMIILGLQWLHGSIYLQGMNRQIGKGFDRLRLHWIPYSILAGSLAALVCGLRWSLYGGTAMILILLIVVRRDRLLFSAFLMAALYDIAIHLFILKGVLLLREDALAFLEAHWGTLLFPLAATAAAAVMPRSRPLAERGSSRETAREGVLE